MVRHINKLHKIENNPFLVKFRYDNYAKDFRINVIWQLLLLSTYRALFYTVSYTHLTLPTTREV